MGRKPRSARHRDHPHRSPPRFCTILAAALHTIIASSLAQRAHAAPANGTLELSSSFQAFQCQHMAIAWQGGVPEYSLTIVSDHVEEFAGISGTSFQWLVDASLGTPVIVSLTDGTGARTDSPVFNVISGPGSSDTCLQRTSSSTSVSSSSSSSSVSAVPTTSSRETPTVLSLDSAAPHLPPGAVAAIVAEAAVLTLSIAGLLIIFFLDHKDRTREQTSASPPVDLLEPPRPRSPNHYQCSGSQSTAAASASPQPVAKELPLRSGTVRRGASATIQDAAVSLNAARLSYTPSEATVVGWSPATSIRESPSSSVRFAPRTDERPRKKRRLPLQHLPSAFPAERVQSAERSSESSWLRDGRGTGKDAVGGFDASTNGGQETDGEPRLLMSRFGA
ncbi:hypothetical protein LXA43DRAFT_1100845 [Ganoderma leucocontextum]|nr:hypothetical protein LXA43DRAFT_1100845 [Ganoderma leucocontextum]